MRETFVVQILNDQNATWQGTVTWTGGKKVQSFRSVLELLKLIGSTIYVEASPETMPEPMQDPRSQ